MTSCVIALLSQNYSFIPYSLTTPHYSFTPYSLLLLTTPYSLTTPYYSFYSLLPGGVAWALLTARVCQLHPNAAPSTLLSKFFTTWAVWRFGESAVHASHAALEAVPRRDVWIVLRPCCCRALAIRAVGLCFGRLALWRFGMNLHLCSAPPSLLHRILGLAGRPIAALLRRLADRYRTGTGS